MNVSKPIIDSFKDDADVLVQNPSHSAPDEILNVQCVMSVEYIGFDNVLHRGQVVVHKDVVGDVRDFFALARDIRFPIFSVIPLSDARFGYDDVLSCDKNNISAFSYRPNTTNPEKLSYHAWGLAFDINPLQNPYMRYDEALTEVERIPQAGKYDLQAPGTLSDVHPLVEFFEKRGWVWGGRWTPESGRTDYQHFEKHIITL